jgi:hypothetical protein
MSQCGAPATASCSHSGGQGPHGCTSIAQEELSALDLEPATAALDHHDALIPLLLELDAQGLESTHHVADVIAVQQVADDGGALGESSQQEDAVRQRLGARQLDGAGDSLDGLDGQLLNCGNDGQQQSAASYR